MHRSENFFSVLKEKSFSALRFAHKNEEDDVSEN
jgi:hypothetical protein